MILPFLCADVSNSNFDKGYSLYNFYEEGVVPIKKDIELFAYCLTNVLNIESNYFANSFVNKYFETQSLFDNRQTFLMDISNTIFEESRFLDKNEEEALNVAFFNSLIKKPTLKGRR